MLLFLLFYSISVNLAYASQYISYVLVLLLLNSLLLQNYIAKLVSIWLLTLDVPLRLIFDILEIATIIMIDAAFLYTIADVSCSVQIYHLVVFIRNLEVLVILTS